MTIGFFPLRVPRRQVVSLGRRGTFTAPGRAGLRPESTRRGLFVDIRL